MLPTESALSPTTFRITNQISFCLQPARCLIPRQAEVFLLHFFLTTNEFAYLCTQRKQNRIYTHDSFFQNPFQERDCRREQPRT
jgi:hypothetical protein